MHITGTATAATESRSLLSRMLFSIVRTSFHLIMPLEMCGNIEMKRLKNRRMNIMHNAIRPQFSGDVPHKSGLAAVPRRVPS